MTEIVVPSGLWADTDTAVVGSWLYEDGAMIQAGVVLAEIMVEKSSFEVSAPASGVLQIIVAEEAEVKAGQVIGRVI